MPQVQETRPAEPWVPPRRPIKTRERRERKPCAPMWRLAPVGTRAPRCLHPSNNSPSLPLLLHEVGPSRSAEASCASGGRVRMRRGAMSPTPPRSPPRSRGLKKTTSSTSTCATRAGVAHPMLHLEYRAKRGWQTPSGLKRAVLVHQCGLQLPGIRPLRPQSPLLARSPPRTRGVQ